MLVYLDLCTIKTGGTGMIILSIGENNMGHVYCLILRKYVVYSELEAKSLGSPWRWKQSRIKVSVRMLSWYNIPQRGSHTNFGNK